MSTIHYHSMAARIGAITSWKLYQPWLRTGRERGSGKRSIGGHGGIAKLFKCHHDGMNGIH